MLLYSQGRMRVSGKHTVAVCGSLRGGGGCVCAPCPAAPCRSKALLRLFEEEAGGSERHLLAVEAVGQDHPEV